MCGYIGALLEVLDDWRDMVYQYLERVTDTDALLSATTLELFVYEHYFSTDDEIKNTITEQFSLAVEPEGWGLGPRAWLLEVIRYIRSEVANR